MSAVAKAPRPRTAAQTFLTALPEPLEADFQKRITDYAELHGWLWTHIPDSRRKAAGTPGAPDLWLVRTARVVALEVKRQSGKVSADQELWRSHFHLGPVLYLVVRPSDWPMIERILA